MFTQCRGCGEIFPLTVDDLITASAMVRCSSCGKVFNSLDTLSDYKPQATEDLILHDSDNPPPLLNHEFKASVVKQSVKNNAAGSADIEELDDGAIFNVKPDFVNDTEEVKTPKKTSMAWTLPTIALLILLVWQASYAIKNGSLQLSEGAIKNQVCAIIKCFTDTKHANLNKIALVSRNIRQHPGRDNALIVTAGIINSDENIQPYPALQVKMSNLNGDIVAMRRFLPSEYLDNGAIAAGMLSNTLVQVTLELQSPGENAVTFEVGFSPTFGAK